MSPVVRWGLRFATCVGVGLALPFLPPPVVPFVVTIVAFGAWALAADDARRDEGDAADLRDVPLVPTAGRARYRPRRVPAA